VTGDEEHKAELEERVTAFDVAAWWENRLPSLNMIATANKAKAATLEKIKLYNPYESVLLARQLSETVDEFLQRLPPTTTADELGPGWIWIANPFIPRPSPKTLEAGNGKIAEEGPPEEGSQLSKFKVLGDKLLQEFETATKRLTEEMAGKPASVLTQTIGKERAKIREKIREYAVDMKVTSGKVRIPRPPVKSGSN
jgi:hypothetical protein